MNTHTRKNLKPWLVPMTMFVILAGVFVTPFTARSVVGMTQTLSAPSSQRVDKRNYSFLSWSDGGGQTHVIRTPAVDTSYTAFYRTKGRR